MPAQTRELHTHLSAQARTWPKSGELVFHIEDDHVWLHKIRLPKSARGQGTARLSEFLARCDAARLPVCLTADPVLDDDAPYDPNDPQEEPATFDLVRWYMRFGFVPMGQSEDGFLMQRDARPPSNAKTIELEARAQKKNDMTYAEFQSRWPPIDLSSPRPSFGV